MPFIYKGRFFTSTLHTVTHFTTLFGFKSPPPDGDTVRVPAGYARRARGLRPPLNFTSTKNCDETRQVETRRDSTRRIERSLDRSKLVESEGRVTSRPDKGEIKKCKRKGPTPILLWLQPSRSRAIAIQARDKTKEVTYLKK